MNYLQRRMLKDLRDRVGVLEERVALLEAPVDDYDYTSADTKSELRLLQDQECCASGRCEVCTPGFKW